MQSVLLLQPHISSVPRTALGTLLAIEFNGEGAYHFNVIFLLSSEVFDSHKSVYKINATSPICPYSMRPSVTIGFTAT
jgi:hypothetical protein